MGACSDCPVLYFVIVLSFLIHCTCSYGSYGSNPYGFSPKPRFENMVKQPYTFRGHKENYMEVTPVPFQHGDLNGMGEYGSGGSYGNGGSYGGGGSYGSGGSYGTGGSYGSSGSYGGRKSFGRPSKSGGYHGSGNSYGGGGSYGHGGSYGNAGSYGTGGSYGQHNGEIGNNIDSNYGQVNGEGKGFGKSKIEYVGGCDSQPPAPLNSGMMCTSLSGCSADCIPNYQFPDGKTQISIICEHGEWKVADENWSVVPSCQPICNPPCENNGICVEPNQCSCPENFSGSLCEYENKPCLEYPETPKNSRRKCRKKMCTISCMFNHEFPDGSSILQYECKNGIWVPMGEKWDTVPDCQAICDPPCVNGGNCLAFNICQCPTEFRGERCEYSVSACNPKKIPFNGSYNCSGDLDSYKCTLSCPDGVGFEYPPEPFYECRYSTGEFVPANVPKCVYAHEVTEAYLRRDENGNREVQHRTSLFPSMHTDSLELELNFTLGFGTTLQHEHEEHNILPKKSACATWNACHYKTFDGKIYSFESKCPHVLLRDSKDNTFSVIVQNSDNCFHSPSTHENECYKQITIYLNEAQYLLKRGDSGVPAVIYKNKILPIPSQLPGIRLTMAPPDLIVAHLDTVGAILKWNGNQLVEVDAEESLWQRTEGLCGIMDGRPENDLITRDGTIPENIITVASSWTARELDDECRDTPLETHACSRPVYGSESEASLYCKNVLNDRRFAVCASVPVMNALLDACKWDYCSCRHPDPAVCVCQTIEMFVQECRDRGVLFQRTWRDEIICPMHCTGGKVYMPCGPPMGEKMCGSTILLPEDSDVCVEGCYCPEGTVLHHDQCISKEECPCRQRGKEFKAGTSIQKDCNTCRCMHGEWICTEVSCGHRCSAVGDPHYTTFDGKSFDFMGQCTYYLVKANTFSIEAENVACAGAISLAMNFPVGVAEGLPACTKAVTVRYNGQVIKLKQNHNVVINGMDYTAFPYASGGVSIRMASSIFMKVELDNGVEVWWDGATRVYIDLPGNFTEKCRGFCGTPNNNQKDDFLTPEDDIESSVIAFGNKFKVSEKCENMPLLPSLHPCDTEIYNKVKAEQYCSKLKSDIFRDCHWFVDPEHFYQDCLYDMCSCRFQVSNCLCPSLSAYASECSRKGVNIDWRSEVRECGIQCTGDQRYQICGNSCTRTCADIASNKNCKPQCVEGCNCPPGEALNENGECIPIGQCQCEHQGMKYLPGNEITTDDGRIKEICACVQASWICRSATAEEYGRIEQINKNMCDANKNFEYTICEDVEPITCKTMHHKEHYSPIICHPGCNCKKGYVLDTNYGTCVKPEECPCHHGGISYKEKATVQNDCNTCTCQNGRWQCTNRQCSGECSTWGDSHYKTFDGRYYDYQGQCNYILAKGSKGSYSFEISIHVLPCGSVGISCPKALNIRIASSDDFESITLTHDKPIPIYSNKKYMTIRQKELMVILESPDIGLRLHWDKGTRIYVKLNSDWKKRVRGLCGNYNDDAGDDFQTPSGGPPEVVPIVFGDSWKLQPYCPEAVEMIDTCESHPTRRVWALKQCGVLKSSLFSACHSEVPIENYYERCVFDTCGCDQGGDCECLCTALAAYAQECNNRGIPIRWRSQELCPIQCENLEYNPCVSTCPYESCDNMLNPELTSCIRDTCIEGCSPVTCPPDHIYSNSTYQECVPKSTCKPVCMKNGNEILYEGDLMEEDECHQCHCSRNQKVCVGRPCSESTQYPPGTQNDYCQPGYTQWINQDPLKPFQTKSTDFEPLPNPYLLGQMEGAKCDRKDMIGIQCRTVGSHIDAKETGHDVECSLERGLICRSYDGNQPCPDFEIRVLCDCPPKEGGGLTNEPCDRNIPMRQHATDCQKYQRCVETPSGWFIEINTCRDDLLFNSVTLRCDPANQVVCNLPSRGCEYGKVFSDCAIECDNLCTDYLYTLREIGKCREGIRCESGCAPMNKTVCPRGYLYADEYTCVAAQNCMCGNENVKHLRPGVVTVIDQTCLHCQCINNFVDCVDTCTVFPSTSPSTPTYDDGGMFTTPSFTSPAPCQVDSFLNLVQGRDPLPDDAFRASSVLSDAFAPENARFESTNLNSGGGWVPRNEDLNQWLEIDFGRQELIYGLIIKGSALYNEYVTSFNVSYSHTHNDDFIFVRNKYRQPQVFRGSYNPSDPVKVMFDQPFEARRIRIHPNTWFSQISLRVEVIGCSAVEHPIVSTTTVNVPERPELCEDEMGLTNGQLLHEQISVSSELNQNYGRDNIRPNLNGWVPLTNSRNEYVVFDMTQERIITGIVTTGGALGWVTAYKVFYSHDKRNWNAIMDENNYLQKIFVGNYDESSPHFSQFDLPIESRYIKIVPYQWSNMIQLRVELIGCFQPYDHTFITVAEAFRCENTCQGIKEPHQSHCFCPSDFYYDGNGCGNRTDCPCVANGVSYKVGATFRVEDCSVCVCKLGGLKQCSPKECPPCRDDERQIVTSTCACACEKCPFDTVLCPTSNICINQELWCNGILDCPDDERTCPLTTYSTPYFGDELWSTTPSMPMPVACPEIDCPPGFHKVQKTPSKNHRYHSYLSSEFAVSRIKSAKTKKTKSAILNRKLDLTNHQHGDIVQTAPSKTHFAKAQNRKLMYGGFIDLQKVHLPTPSNGPRGENICPEFRCVRIPPKFSNGTCPPVECPPDYIPLHDPNQDLRRQECPNYICEPPPQDKNCTVTGDIFKSFDDSTYKYDICYHILARDAINEDWMVALKKNCTQKECARIIVIKHGDNEFILDPSIKKVIFNGYTYRPCDLAGISDEFEVKTLGDTITFNSNRYGFWVVFHKNGNVIIGVVRDLIRRVDGLCGYYDGNPVNDKRNPQGEQLRTTEEFSNSWALVNDKPGQCNSPICPPEILKEAEKICNQVWETPLLECTKYVNMDSFISKCVENTWMDLVSSKKDLDQIRCAALQMFSEECLAVTNEVDLSDWRTYHNCPTECKAPFIFHDCYQRQCEPTCDTIDDQYTCPKIRNMCFPGCYCPPGLVRHKNTCVEPSRCRNSVCHLMPTNDLITADGNTFPIDGNCVYILARDLLDMYGQHRWQVLVTKVSCDYNQTQSCLEKITILYNKNKIHIYLSENRRHLRFSINKEVLRVYDDLPHWVKVTESPDKHLTFVFPEEQLEVKIQYPKLATAIYMPSHKYASKVEGLCGDANGDYANDNLSPDKFPINNISELTLSWLFDLPGQIRENCKTHEHFDNGGQPEICEVLLDSEVFGQCSNIIDPNPMYQMCRESNARGSCSLIEYYAQQCASKGFCIDWRGKESLCAAEKCPSGQVYRTCSPQRQVTCEDVAHKYAVLPSDIPVEGCFCPHGQVLKEDDLTCVPLTMCQVCDAEGHHGGDVWKKDKCTTCRCEDSSVVCNTEVCSALDVVCAAHQVAVLIDMPGDDQCCPRYICQEVPENITQNHCIQPRPLQCGEDQIMKAKVDIYGCSYFVCECIPKSQCPSVSESFVPINPNDPGFISIMEEAGCCPKYKLVCMEDKCPHPEPCPPNFDAQIQKDVGQCCPHVHCEPSKDMCSFETTYTAAESGGERLMTQYEKQILFKLPHDHWQDGPCRSCECVMTKAGYQPLCTLQTCPMIENHVDFNDYELTTASIYKQCCLYIKRVACKYKDRVYQVGESWREGSNPCINVLCVQGENGVQKEITMQTCEKNCALGYIYQEPLPGSGQCCGYCEQIGCRSVDGQVYKIGQEWTFDYCTYYVCAGTNGSAQVETKREICEPEPQDMQDFIYDISQGKCCKNFTPTACRDGHNIYQIGEYWRSPTDLCTTYTCVKRDRNRLEKQISMEKCRRDCPPGWEYRTSPQKCCGTCFQIACSVAGTLKRVGTTWMSPNGCTTYRCEDINGEVVISAAEEKCPSVDCDISEQYKEGCCVICRISRQKELVRGCAPQSLPLEDTIGLIRVQRFPEGTCINKEPIRGFTDCYGGCNSGTYYDKMVGSHESNCKCCQAKSFQTLSVVLDCENGQRMTKPVAVPAACDCLECGTTNGYGEVSSSNSYSNTYGGFTQYPMSYRKQTVAPKQALDKSRVPAQRGITGSSMKQPKLNTYLPEDRKATGASTLPPFPQHKKSTPKPSENKKLIETRKFMLNNMKNQQTTQSPTDRAFNQLLEAFGNSDQGNNKNRRKESSDKRSSGEINQLIDMLENEKKLEQQLQENNDQEFEQQLESFK